MTNILISNITKAGESSIIELTDGNKTAFVSTFSNGVINVLNSNQTHKAYRGFGQMFGNWEAAEAAYKSGFMKAAIQTAREAI